MVKAIIDIPDRQNKVINIVKGIHGFKNRNEALSFIIEDYEKNLELEVRPGYLEKLRKISKEKHHSFKDMADLRRQVEDG